MHDWKFQNLKEVNSRNDGRDARKGHDPNSNPPVAAFHEVRILPESVLSKVPVYKITRNSRLYLLHFPVLKSSTVTLLISLLSLQASAADLLREDFSYSDGLITNETAHWSPTNPSAVYSPIWDQTSGTFYAQGNQGWTGMPDSQNNSAVFRVTTQRADFRDVSVSFSLLNQGLTTTARTPAVAWDGLHIFLRYQTEAHLYYASLNRRDNTVIIKKKIPGGPSNGGTYYNLSPAIPFNVPYNAWQSVKATVKTNPNQSVTIQLFQQGQLLASATDTGAIGGPPITAAGRVGIRGDNANLKFDNFLVQSLDSPPLVVTVPTPTPIPTSTPFITTSRPRQNVLNKALGDSQLVLICPNGSPTIYSRRGQLLRQNLPSVSLNEYAWDGRSDTGQVLASGLYRETCGSEAYPLVIIR
jgi:hypothetical protein